ncbi:MAG: CoA transferase [Deltaproteobacteria bacterium]|nr:CoA transferase [Deltaproteobacteria bacterium]
MLEKGALTGITVLDLSRLLPGPFGSMILADHGARVISIEDKRFIADGFFITTVNRNKEHLSLDLKTPEGKEIFFRLVKTADVVMEGFRPGVVQRLGVDFETVCKVNPGIIYCSITGYGQTGPYVNRAGHDVNYLSIAGILDLIGQTDSNPAIPGVQIADIAGGGMNAVIGILLALVARNQTGKGQYIDISMTDGMLGFLSIPLFFHQLTRQIPTRSDAVLSHRYACYNTYETADGRFLSIGAVEHRFWKKLCEHLEFPEFIDLQYDDGMRMEIIDTLRAVFRQKTLARWSSEFGDLDICWGKVQHLEEVLKDPLFREREMVVDLETKDGKTTPVFGVPVKLSQTPGKVRTPAVGFGESTVSILREIGYAEDDIAAFQKKGIV